MKYSSKVAALCISVTLATSLSFADGDIPTVTDVSMQQGPGNRIVTIKYKLDSYPAVVTLDVKTNDTVSIGGEHIWNAEGAVWRKVTSADADGSGWCTITWDPTQSWKDGNGNGFKAQDVKAEITAWPLDNTPDYMAVDLTATGGADTQNYYPAADFVPSGVTNDIYKTSMLLMRKIMAKDVTWTMGSIPLETQRTAGNETPHQISLTNNYYIGVYEITQSQFELIRPNRYNNVNLKSFSFSAPEDSAMRPADSLSYNELRNSDTSAENAAYNWPAAPNPNSFLGKLRTMTGIDFDLPSEAQWEFAARAGNGVKKWGDGSTIQNTDTDANLGLLGRYERNGGKIWDGSSYVKLPDPLSTYGATNGTAIVGSYLPNDWGIYDMSGNLFELCLDWYVDDITAHGGKVNINPANSQQDLTGASGSKRVIRGGNYTSVAGKCRPASRDSANANDRWINYGVRVACTAGLR